MKPGQIKLLRVLFVALLALLTALAPAHAQDFPELTGRVVDQADILSADEQQALTQKLAALEANSTRQMVVATVDSLQGYEIEEYGYQLGRAWGIGHAEDGNAEKDNGIILLVAPNDRKVRIEVGYGLEGIMTDALSSIIIQNDILPRFRDNDYPGGIDAGVDRILTQLTLPPDEARSQAQAAVEQQRESSKGGFPFGLIFWLAIMFFFVLPGLFSRRKGRRYRSGLGPVVIWGSGMGGSSWGGGSSGGGFGGGGFGGGFSGGGGSFGGGGASGGW